MKKINYFYLSILTFSLLFVSCKKEEHEHDQDKPTITIINPTDNAVIKNGSTLAIKGVVNDVSLHELVIKLTYTTSGNIILNETPVVHDLTHYSFDYNYTFSVSSSTTFTLEIIAMDHSENTATEKRILTINP